MHCWLFQCCIKYRDWSNSKKVVFIWPFCPRGQESMLAGSHSSKRQAWQRGQTAETSHLQMQAWSRKSHLELERDYRHWNPILSSTLPPTKPHLISLHTAQPIGTKYANIWTWRGHPHPSHYRLQKESKYKFYSYHMY